MDVNASVEGRDLGSVAGDIQKKINQLGELPKGMHIRLRGQNEVMHESFSTLGLGIILAMALVYLLMVVLFQSWLDPFIIMVAVPGALMGVLWMLVITGTTINVVSLMGAIVAVGIAVSNSILVVNFANDIRVEKNLNPVDAVLEAGKTRLRPGIDDCHCNGIGNDTNGYRSRRRRRTKCTLRSRSDRRALGGNCCYALHCAACVFHITH